MNIIPANIIEFIGKPRFRKTSEFAYYYRKCRVSYIGGELETEIVSKTYDGIMAYKIGSKIRI